MSLLVVILAAGHGKRMCSDLPKVLHPLAGKPMLEHVLRVADSLSERPPIVVHGHSGPSLFEALVNREINWVEQSRQLGTGHAVEQVLPHVETDSIVLILCGDVPLLKISSLKKLVAAAIKTGFAVLTANVPNPHGYGRIIQSGADLIERIVEEKDASDAETKITEVSTGIMAVRAEHLKSCISRLDNDNAQSEYYLTDCVALAVADGINVANVPVSDPDEASGVNDRRDLARVERLYQNRLANDLMDAGVTLVDPQRLDIRGDVDCGRDVFIDINVVFQGRVRLGNNVNVGPNNIIIDCGIGNNVSILSNCVLESADIGDRCRIGPFSRVRPNSVLGNDVRIGNFVEIKESNIASGSKVNHLSYVGDSEIGNRVNVGAGVITCNYDGANKHKTIIEDDVFVGSNTEIVAPITIKKGVTIGAGTTVTEDVESDRLVISRARQKSVPGWRRPKKN